MVRLDTLILGITVKGGRIEQRLEIVNCQQHWVSEQRLRQLNVPTGIAEVTYVVCAAISVNNADSTVGEAV